MATLDIFKADAFSLLSMSQAFSKIPYVPGRISELGLFGNPESISTTEVAIEKYEETLAIVPTTPRGGPGIQNTKGVRSVRNLRVPHYQIDDAVMADEVQNIRAFGSMTELDSVQAEINRRQRRMANLLDATVEWQRMGALKGLIYDVRPDGTTEIMYNLYTEMGETQETFSLGLANASTEVINSVTDIAKFMEDELGMFSYQRIHALVGYDLWKTLITHPKVVEPYKNFMRTQGDIMIADYRYRGFMLGNMTFEVYRGRVSGQDFIASNEGVAFPLGVNNLFQSAFAPADYTDTVNTPGLPRYAFQYPRDDKKGVNFQFQTNYLAWCTRPRLCVKLTV